MEDGVVDNIIKENGIGIEGRCRRSNEEAQEQDEGHGVGSHMFHLSGESSGSGGPAGERRGYGSPLFETTLDRPVTLPGGVTVMRIAFPAGDGAPAGFETGKFNLVNNFCIAVPTNEGRCTHCHTGYGWADNTFAFNDPKTIDCLIATFCIDQAFSLLYSDRDFDLFVTHLGLKTVL